MAVPCGEDHVMAQLLNIVCKKYQEDYVMAAQSLCMVLNKCHYLPHTDYVMIV
jgi:hypothetical protein